MRKEPYTERGIRRVPCCRCGEPSVAQWHGCALDKWMALCAFCDVGLNRATLVYLDVPNVDEIIQKYKEAR